MTTQQPFAGNVIAFPLDRVRPSSGATEATIVRLGRAPIPVLDNSAAIAACEAAAALSLRLAARSEEFAAIARLAGDDSAANAALDAAQDHYEDAYNSELHAGFLAETDGQLQPTMQNWRELSEDERDGLVDDYFAHHEGAWTALISGMLRGNAA